MYIAGHISPHGDICRNECENHTDFKDCTCCDRFDMSDLKYYRNVHSLPRSLMKMHHPKLATDNGENFAVIEFFDEFDQKIVWILTEDKGFQEQFN